MNKVLLISHGLENSAWGTVARNMILAMDIAGIDVVPRFIRLGKANAVMPQRIKELYQKSSQNCDICIQFVLPHYFVCNKGFKKNIGYLTLEHHGLKHTQWCQSINLMDELWSPCKETIEYAYYDGFNKPVYYIPYAFDLTQFKVLPPLQLTPHRHFRFYFIGELHRRKHIASLLRAFHSEFHSNEPVDLILKLNKFGLTSEEVVDETRLMCKQVKESLRIYKDERMYKEEIVIGQYYSDEDILRLHQSCDCFVSSTYGEAFLIDAFVATLYNNYPIVTYCGGMKDYIIDNITGKLISAQNDSIIGLHDMFDGIGTGREWWWNINSFQLQKAMRLAYHRTKSQFPQDHAWKIAQTFSLKNVGARIKERLNA